MQEEANRTDAEKSVPKPPKGLMLLMVLGPGLIWAGEYIGSGEVILATRSGAILGMMALWVPILGIFAKFWIGLAGARYTVCTGEGMIDMLGRTPGPRNWVIYPVFIGQLCSGAIATGGLASVAAVFAHYFIPIPEHYLGWAISLGIVALVWSGRYSILQKVMTLLVVVILIGVLDVAWSTWPGIGAILSGTFGFQIPEPAAWAYPEAKTLPSAWAEMLPLLGWAAGGFASQVWYTYWVLGAGYGMARGRGYGEPLDAERLRSMDAESANRVKGWCRVVAADATMALCIGSLVTTAFMIAGAGVLRPAEIAPEGSSVALEVSRIFSDHWGEWGARLFMLAGLAAMMSTMLGQFAGWPRLLADCARLLVPKVSRYPWKTQFRFVLVLYAVSNLVLVYGFSQKPVVLVKLGAILDGLLLTPLQALAVGMVLYIVMPKFFSTEVQKVLRPNPVYALGLLLAFVVFTYFCAFQIPRVMFAG